MSIEQYRNIILKKRIAFEMRGMSKWGNLPSSLFPHQVHGVEFALRAGCAALFYDTGLGKTAMALSWAQQVIEYTNKPVLMLAPLAVGPQHVREAARLGIDAQVIRDGAEITGKKVYVLNYDRLDKVDATIFGGVILDESSILKSFTGITTRKLIEMFARVPFRLACTATPAPNDHTELGTHAEFLSVMRRDEMLPIWFIHDSADTCTWRIKGHAQDDFWRWVASWARCVSKPSDLGFDDTGFILPELVTHRHEVISDVSNETGAEKDGQNRLFRIPEMSATSVHREKRFSQSARADVICEKIMAETSEPWIVWCETNDEADALVARLPKDCTVEVRGQHSADEKERKLISFSQGESRIIITKPSIAGFGLNWQHAARQAFIGLSFSYESYYQAVRRSWRFGQKRPVHVHIACADTERTIYETVTRKAEDHGTMKRAMEKAMRNASQSRKANVEYMPTKEATLPAWIAA